MLDDFGDSYYFIDAIDSCFELIDDSLFISIYQLVFFRLLSE